MGLLEFRRWRATPEGAVEFAWWQDAWAEAEVAMHEHQQALWVQQAPKGKRRGVHRSEAG